MVIISPVFIVPPERSTREHLIAFAKGDPEAIANLLLILWDRVEALEARVRELESNSRKSAAHLPPTAAISTLRPSPGVYGASPNASPAVSLRKKELSALSKPVEEFISNSFPFHSPNQERHSE